MTLPCKSDPGLTAISWQFSICVRMIHYRWNRFQKRQVIVPTVRFYSLGLTFGYKLIVFFPSPCIRHQNLASFWNDFAHNTTLNTLYFCIIHEYWNNCGHNVGSHLEWLCIHHCPWTTQLSPNSTQKGPKSLLIAAGCLHCFYFS